MYLKILVILLLLFNISLWAKENPNDKPNKSNTFAKTSLDRQTRAILNIGNWGYWIENDGKSAHDPNGASGGFFPRGTAAAIYQDGIVWGGYVNDDPDPDRRPLRVGGQTYNIGTTAGWINSDGSAASPNDDRAVIYRIRNDWRNYADDKEGLRRDAQELFVLAEASDVTPAQLDELYQQYKNDWMTWPVDLGAPYVDVNNNGSYDPVLDSDGAAIQAEYDENGVLTAGGDYPGYANADQLIWFVVNDLNEANTANLYGSDPLGIELQVTMWAYNQPSSALGQIAFKRFQFINKSNFEIDSMFVSQWSDPDLGQASDDLAGCDIENSIGFAYNGFRNDSDYDIFNLPPPAVGYDFFAGPLVKGQAGQDLNKNGVDDANDFGVFNLKKSKQGYINLPMTSFLFFAAGSDISDPALGEYDSSKEWYNMLNGYTPTNDLTSPTPYVVGSGLEAGQPTKYPLSGDPFLGTGDVDGTGTNFAPGDRRIGMASGPFTMAPGDTQEIVLAVVGGIVNEEGGDNRNAVAQMKLNDRFAQFLYDNLFEDIPKPPDQPQVKASQLDGKLFLDWGSSEGYYASTEGPGVLGYEFEGYNIYQLPAANAPLETATKIATYDLDNGVQIIRGEKFLPSFKDIVTVPLQIGTDTGIKRYITLDRDYVNDQALYNGNTYYFAVTAYNYNSDPLVPTPALESGYTVFSLIPQDPTPGTEYGLEPEELVTIDHSSGVADGFIEVKVIDYDKLTGHNYNVTFEPWHYYRDIDGVWKRTASDTSVVPLSVLSKVNDISPSTVTGAALAAADVGTIDFTFTLDLQAPGGAWSDGIKIDMPDGLQINSYTALSGDNYGNNGADGQNIVNVDGTYDAGENSITWGDSARSGFGAIEGTIILVINTEMTTFPVNVDYEVYDDGYDGTVIDAAGTISIAELGYEFRTDNTWKFTDLTDSEVLLEGQTYFYTLDEEFTANAPIVDGLQVVVRGFFGQPINFASVVLTPGEGSTTTLTSNSSTSTLDIQNYTIFGGTVSSYAIDNFGVGTTDGTKLVEDYELRFTGQWATTDVNGQTVDIVESGGQMATCFRMVSGAALATHPLNPSPGTAAPFLVRIPFEVWNVSDPDNEYQVNLTFRDRLRDGTEDPFDVWNRTNRMYAVIVNSPYDENQVIQVDDGPDAINADATWVLVFYGTNASLGDVVKINYPNPIVFGSDIYAFTTDGIGESFSETKQSEDIKKINVFPNPYYAYNPEEPDRFNRFVTFNHLPRQATIRIFDLAGVQVRKLEKDVDSQYFRWDLRNESNLPVASGIYIAHIDMDGIGEKVLKIMVIQGQEVLRFY